MEPPDINECGICHHGRANVVLSPCGHILHAKCVPIWPLSHCPICPQSITEVGLIICEMEDYSTWKRSIRKGRWLDNEWEYIKQVDTAFRQGILPIGETVKLKQFLCDVVQCSSPRLSAKIKTGKLVYHSKIKGSESSAEIAEIQASLNTLADMEELFISALIESDPEIGLVTSVQIEREWALQFQAHAFAVGQTLSVSKRVVSRTYLASISKNLKGLRACKTLKRSFPHTTMTSLPSYENIDDMEPSSSTSLRSDALKYRCKRMSPTETDRVVGFGGSDGIALFELLLGSSSPVSGETDNYTAQSCSMEMPYSTHTGIDDHISYVGSRTATIANSPTDRGCESIPPSVPTSTNQLITNSMDCFLSSMLQCFPYECVDLWAPVYFRDKIVLAMGAKATRVSSLLPWIDYSFEFLFEHAAGVPGRVYISHRAECIPDLQRAQSTEFHRLDGALRTGIRSTVALPVRSVEGSVVVCMLYSTRVFTPDDRLLDEMTAFLSDWKLSVQDTDEPKGDGNRSGTDVVEELDSFDL